MRVHALGWRILKISLILLTASLTTIVIFQLLRVPSSPVLGVLQFAVVIAFTATLLNLSTKLSIHASTPHGSVCIVFLAASTLLLISVVLQLHSFIRAGLSLFVSSFLPGYCLVSLTGINPPRSYLETVVLSYVLSISITAIMGTAVFFLAGEGFEEATLTLTYFFMSLLLLLLTLRSHGSRIHRDEIVFETTEALFLLIIGTVFLLFTVGFYPLMAYVPSYDIARHFGSVQQIVRAPELLISFYPWFDFYEAVFFVLSKASLECFQTSLALSGFIVILAFHVKASIYLREIDQRLPIIATAFWSIFGGFGWLLLLKETLQTNRPFFDLLRSVNDVSYVDISIPRVWFWFRPMIVSFTLLFTLIYLLKRHDIPTIHFRLIYSILIAALALFHLPELVILVVVMTVLSFFATDVDLRLKDAIVSSVIGLSAAVPLSIFFCYYARATDPIFHSVLLWLIPPLALSYFASKSGWKGINIFSKSGKIVVYAILVVYIAGTMSWLADPSFSISMAVEIAFVPWLLYPVRLGLVGLFGLIGLLVVRRHKENRVVLFVWMIFSTLVFARIISYVNISLFMTRFYEQRFVQASLLPAASILAALAMKPVMTKIMALRHLNIKRAFAITLTSSLIVVVGTTSLFLAYDYHIEFSTKWAIGEEELSSIDFLSSVLYDNPRSPVLAFTSRSMTEVGFSSPIFIVDPLHLPAWSSINPEIPLLVLFRGDPQYTAPYVYLHDRDRDTIAERFPNGILLKEVTPMLSSIHQNEKVELYKVPEGSPPLMDCPTALFVPLSSQEQTKAMLPFVLWQSLEDYEYTTMLDSDSSALKKDIIIMLADTTSVVVDHLLEGPKEDSDKKLIVFNSMGFGSIGEDLFSRETATEDVRVNLIEGVDKLLLPFDVNVTAIKARENVEVLGWFSGEEDERVPFVARKAVNGVKVIYVNICPLISEITTRSADEAAALLEAMLNTVELGLRKFSTADFKLEDLLYFKDASFEGEIVVKASSIIFPSTEKIQLKLDGEHEIYNVCSISLTGVDYTVIRTNHGQIGQGMGFYTKLMLGDPTFELNGEEIRVEARLQDDEVIQLNESSTIEFHTQGWTSIYARTPTLSILGNSTFQEAYGLHRIYRELRASGQTLRSSDNLNFTILASDVYTIAKDLSWTGPVQRDPPILQWNELKSLQDSIPWFALAIVIVFMSDRIMAFWEKKNRRTP